jgi:hypothetical protein
MTCTLPTHTGVTPWSTVHVEKLKVSLTGQQISPFYVTRKFTTVFTTARNRSLSLRRINQMHTLQTDFPKIHFNIVLYACILQAVTSL